MLGSSLSTTSAGPSWARDSGSTGSLRFTKTAGAARAGPLPSSEVHDAASMDSATIA